MPRKFGPTAVEMRRHHRTRLAFAVVDGVPDLSPFVRTAYRAGVRVHELVSLSGLAERDVRTIIATGVRVPARGKREAV